MATVAYVRVSTDRQDVENQRLEILTKVNELGIGPVKFFEDEVSSRVPWDKRKVGTMVEGLAAGDVVVVAELSRLGRSILEIFEILSILTRHEVRLYAVKNNWQLDGGLQSKIIAMAYALAAEIEGDLIRQRTKAALDAKRRKLAEDGSFVSKAGRVVTSLGRPPGPGKSKLDKHAEEILELLKLGVMRKRVADKFNTTDANLRHWLSVRGFKDVGKNEEGGV